MAYVDLTHAVHGFQLDTSTPTPTSTLQATTMHHCGPPPPQGETFVQTGKRAAHATDLAPPLKKRTSPTATAGNAGEAPKVTMYADENARRLRDNVIADMRDMIYKNIPVMIHTTRLDRMLLVQPSRDTNFENWKKKVIKAITEHTPETFVNHLRNGDTPSLNLAIRGMKVMPHSWLPMLMIYLGANVKATDNKRHAPLHCCATVICELGDEYSLGVIPFDEFTAHLNEVYKVVKCLIEYGTPLNPIAWEGSPWVPIELRCTPTQMIERYHANEFVRETIFVSPAFRDAFAPCFAQPP